MKESHFRITGDLSGAEGIIKGDDGKTLDKIAINVVAAIAEKLGLDPTVSAVIFRKGTNGTEGAHKRPEPTKTPGVFKPVAVGK